MITFVLTDIEGTTSSIDFVHKVLFPYSAERLPDYVKEFSNSPAVAKVLQEVKDICKQEELEHNGSLDDSIKILLEWIKQDRKISPLKTLQGYIWDYGFKNGAFKGHVYPDVVPKLKEWKDKKIMLGIYSSGSVKAQKLLFGHSDQGDLTPMFDAFFDTQVGGKKEADSYQRISQKLSLPASEILFLSDVEAELDAAKSAGMQTHQLVREKTVPCKSHPVAHSFSEL